MLILDIAQSRETLDYLMHADGVDHSVTRKSAYRAGNFAVDYHKVYNYSQFLPNIQLRFL